METKQIRLATTDEVCVVLECVSHWPEGFTLHMALFLAAATKEIPHFLHHPLAPPPPPGGPSLAVRFADGRKATTPDPLDHARDIGEMVTLNVTSTVGGGETHLRQGIYVHPLPPPGPVVIAVRWPARGVGEASTELDGAEIRAGAARALRIWD
ncbi:hypothetical protein [Lentzea xinjiangensis]|uniref:hypothetical protein n=1 Tax=Lentzea xinjiangensis TaxID=402600 RepID=UPI00116052C9|nr:hypothetical protein [Lentzea xinjiangensis]